MRGSSRREPAIGEICDPESNKVDSNLVFKELENYFALSANNISKSRG